MPLSRVFFADNRWQYEIVDDAGTVLIAQDYDPDAPGFVPMDETSARSKAEAVLSRVLSV